MLTLVLVALLRLVNKTEYKPLIAIFATVLIAFLLYHGTFPKSLL